MDHMRHRSRGNVHDNVAGRHFAETTGSPDYGVGPAMLALNGAGVDAELAPPHDYTRLREIRPCLDHPAVGCPHVDRSMCALAKGLTVMREDPCPWVTFTYADAANRVLVHLDRHSDSRAASRAAVERNCHWGRVIRTLENGDYIVERMGSPPQNAGS